MLKKIIVAVALLVLSTAVCTARDSYYYDQEKGEQTGHLIQKLINANYNTHVEPDQILLYFNGETLRTPLENIMFYVLKDATVIPCYDVSSASFYSLSLPAVFGNLTSIHAYGRRIDRKLIYSVITL